LIPPAPVLPPLRFQLPAFLPRLLSLFLLFTLELCALSFWLDNAVLAGRGAVEGFVFAWGSWILKAAVGFTAIYPAFSWAKNQALVAASFPPGSAIPFSTALLIAHGLAMAVFIALSNALYSGTGITAHPGPAFIVWFIAGILGIAMAAIAFLPPGFWHRLFRGTALLSCCAAGTVLLACVGGNSLRTLWAPLVRLTFFIVAAVLKPVLPNLIANPALATLGTQRFSVEIAPQCSGLEGIGLFLAFGTAWLVLFRKEFRFPHVLLALPSGVFVIFLLNALRIAALILIGNAGAPAIAIGGFHSQSGWIAFLSVALAFPLLASRIPWLTGVQRVPVPGRRRQGPVEPYLWPFAAILSAGMLSAALTSRFEWLYPVRFAAALLAFWYFRRTYAAWNWKVGWRAPVTGTLVCIVWIGMARTLHISETAMPAALAAASPAPRAMWIVFRVLAASLTVPLAEELAFRGFMLRRLISPQFQLVPFTGFTWFSLLVSSLAFGLLHGRFWPAGIVAGLGFALVQRSKGSVGDAVAAHAVANVLLAVTVLCFGQWQFW
jgi:exosortase E/protease (VPEID-CTERM system)